MEKIVSAAGFMLTQAIDTINRTNTLVPMFVGFKKGCIEVKKRSKCISLEQSIPKMISIYENNKEDVEYASIAFPAEVEEAGVRESVIMLMAQKYRSDEYIIVSLPYKMHNGKAKVKEYELLDYSPFLLEKLPNLEKIFVEGLLSYGDASEIWDKESNIQVAQ
jgi:hypothetical protein